MLELTVVPVGDAWTVRHDRALFERFPTRQAALCRALKQAAALRLAGHTVSVTLDAGRTSRFGRCKLPAARLIEGLGTHLCETFTETPRLDAPAPARYPKAA